MDSSVFAIVLAVLAAIVLTILAYVFVIPDKKRTGLKKFWRFVHDWLNFKFLIVEKIIQFFYVFSTVLIVCFGFVSLFVVEKNYWTGRAEWYGWVGLLIMVLGPIAIRISYELIMMFILVLKNVIQINNKLRDQNQTVTPAQPVVPPVYHTAPASEPAPAPTGAKFCSHCGAHLDENGHCPNCS